MNDTENVTCWKSIWYRTDGMWSCEVWKNNRESCILIKVGSGRFCIVYYVKIKWECLNEFLLRDSMNGEKCCMLKFIEFFKLSDDWNYFQLSAWKFNITQQPNIQTFF